MPNLSGTVASVPQGELGWQCKRCEHIFPKGLDMCPQCTSLSVKEIRVPKTRRGDVEAREAAEAAAGVSAPSDSSEATGDPTDSVPDGAGDQDGADYDAWTKNELKNELEKRGLTKSGNVTDLVDRLLADDQAKAEAEAQEVDDGVEPAAGDSAGTSSGD